MTQTWQSASGPDLLAPAAASRLDLLSRPVHAVAQEPAAFLFGRFRLEPARQLLLEDGRPVKLGSRAFMILLALVRRAGSLVGRDELFAAAWPGTFVDDCNLRTQVAGLRRALGDGRDGRRLIVNIPGRGYQFVEPVQQAAGSR